jgi:hypothetical protein
MADNVEAESCQNCRFWYPSWKFKKQQRYETAAAADAANPRVMSAFRKDSDKGLCRRYAPTASALTTVWMETRCYDWCGDFQRMTEREG